MKVCLFFLLMTFSFQLSGQNAHNDSVKKGGGDSITLTVKVRNGNFNQAIIEPPSQRLDKILVPVIVAVITGIAGIYFNRSLEKYKREQGEILAKINADFSLRKEYDVLRDRTALLHQQRQIEELYSPLLGLIQYSLHVFTIYDRKKQTLDSKGRGELEQYFNEKYFLPINQKIANLIKEKIYLIPSDQMPESFQQFLKHEAQFACQYTLWKEKGISSKEIQGLGWPISFEGDAMKTLEELRRVYNLNLKQITPVNIVVPSIQTK